MYPVLTYFYLILQGACTLYIPGLEEPISESEDEADINPSKPGEMLFVEQDTLAESTPADDSAGLDKLKRNYLDLSQTAGASLRYGVSSSAKAAIYSGLLSDQIRGKVLPPEKKYSAVDKNKIIRAKERIMKESQVKDEQRNQDEVITGIFADGRKDKTKVVLEDSTTGRFHQ